MTDTTHDDLKKRLRLGNTTHVDARSWMYDAADRIDELEAENARLGQQCEGLMQAGMNNGQALILAEAKLAQAVEALMAWKHYDESDEEDHVSLMLNYGEAIEKSRATLAELKGRDDD